MLLLPRRTSRTRRRRSQGLTPRVMQPRSTLIAGQHLPRITTTLISFIQLNTITGNARHNRAQIIHIVCRRRHKTCPQHRTAFAIHRRIRSRIRHPNRHPQRTPILRNPPSITLKIRPPRRPIIIAIVRPFLTTTQRTNICMSSTHPRPPPLHRNPLRRIPHKINHLPTTLLRRHPTPSTRTRTRHHTTT